MTCLKLLKPRRLSIIFRENTTISLNKLTGYVELSDFHEIWPEHSLTIEEQKTVGNFIFVYIMDISLVTAAKSTVGKSFDPTTLRVCKNIKTQENPDAL